MANIAIISQKDGKYVISDGMSKNVILADDIIILDENDLESALAENQQKKRREKCHLPRK